MQDDTLHPEVHSNMPRLQPGGECDPGSLSYDPCRCLEEPENNQTRTGLRKAESCQARQLPEQRAVRPACF